MFTAVTEKYLNEDDRQKLAKATVGIAGAGGLGSNCAMHLVRCGFGRFVIVDYDCVELSNLNRQFYYVSQVGRPKVKALADNLKQINPDLIIEGKQQKMTPANVVPLFAACDVVVEAVDVAETKKMIVEKLAATEKFVVSASGLAGTGDSDAIQMRYARRNVVIIGDLVSAVSNQRPPLAPRVAIAAAKQADAVLTYVLKVLFK